jgi:hypothetical protein
MAQVDVVVFGTTAPSSGCGCCSTACCDPGQSMEKEAGGLKGSLVDKYGEAVKFHYVDVMSKEMKDYPEIQKILNRVHLPLTVINGKPSFHGGLSLEKIAGAVSELLE